MTVKRASIYTLDSANETRAWKPDQAREAARPQNLEKGTTPMGNSQHFGHPHWPARLLIRASAVGSGQGPVLCWDMSNKPLIWGIGGLISPKQGYISDMLYEIVYLDAGQRV